MEYISEILIAFLITSTITCTLAIIKKIYKFKITSIDCCFSCIKIERDVNLEQSIDAANTSRCIPSLRSESTTRTINLANTL